MGTPRRRKPTRTCRWPQRVTRESDALDLDREVFTWSDPRRIARSLERAKRELGAAFGRA
jgi:hypothetical protein